MSSLIILSGLKIYMYSALAKVGQKERTYSKVLIRVVDWFTSQLSDWVSATVNISVAPMT